MKLTLRNRITLGFIVNILVVLTTGIVYVTRVYRGAAGKSSEMMDWLLLTLIAVSLVLLIVVYFIILNQVKARNETRQLLQDNKHLLQSVIDSSANLVTIKKLNGEYLLVNEKFAKLFNLSISDIIGKTSADFMDPETANVFKESDLAVMREEKELHTEVVINLADGKHTYIAVKFPLFDASGRIYAVGGISTEITDRKITEDSMKEGDKFFQMSLDMLVIATEEKFLKINPSVSKVLGYDEKELLSKPWSDFIVEEDVEMTGNTISKLKQGVNTVNFENRWKCKDGSIKWLSWTATSNEIKGVPVFYAVAHDVTERRKVLESLKMFEQFFRMSFDLMVVANEKYFIKANPAYTRILGFDKSELGKAPFLSFIHPDDQERAKVEVEKLIKGTTMINFRARVRCKDKSYKWLEWNATTDMESGLLYGVARDVTDEVKLEEEERDMVQQLYEREQRLRLILDNIGDGVIVVNKEGQVVMANYIANALYQNDGEGEFQADLSELYDLYYPDEKTVFPSQNLPTERALRGEETEDVDVVIWDDEHQIKRRVLISGRPIVDQKNEVVAAVVTLKDISRYKQMEEELKEAKSKYRRAIGFKKSSDAETEEDEKNDDQEKKVQKPTGKNTNPGIE